MRLSTTTQEGGEAEAATHQNSANGNVKPGADDDNNRPTPAADSKPDPDSADERSKEVIGYFSLKQVSESIGFPPPPGPEPSASEIVAAQEYARKKVKEAKEEHKKKKEALRSRHRMLDGGIEKARTNNDEKLVAKLAASKEEEKKKVDEAKKAVEEAEAALNVMSSVTIPDEIQPWYEQIYANGTNYYIENGINGWNQVNETNAGRFLKDLGIDDRKDSITSPLDRTFLTLQKRYKVDHAGPLAGYRPGLIHYNGNKILITRGPNLITPVKGEFPAVREFIDGMLQGQVEIEGKLWEQSILAYCWLHLAVTPIYSREPMTGQVLVLAGAKDTGKSVFQKLLVTPMLGGRMAAPYQYMVGDTTFNQDWFAAEHLMIEDEGGSKSIEARNGFASKLKQIAVNEDHRSHGKTTNAVYLQPCWRATVSVNDDPEHIRILPHIDNSMRDKLIILKAYEGATVGLVERLGGKEEFRAKIKEELPAFIYWLLNDFQIPAELKATRLGMKAFQHPDILDSIDETSPEMMLFEHMEIVWVGCKHEDIPASEAMRLLAATYPAPGVLPRSPSTFGTYLRSLAKKTKRVTWRKLGGKTLYTIDFSDLGSKAPTSRFGERQ
jgi:hypothetical protein